MTAAAILRVRESFRRASIENPGVPVVSRTSSESLLALAHCARSVCDSANYERVKRQKCVRNFRRLPIAGGWSITTKARTRCPKLLMVIPQTNAPMDQPTATKCADSAFDEGSDVACKSRHRLAGHRHRRASMSPKIQRDNAIFESAPLVACEEATAGHIPCTNSSGMPVPRSS